jgi:hypothetical protein
VDVHKRATGWGWGEIFTPDGRCMAILDHLGELLLRDQEIPMRLEADTFQRETGDFGERLVFPVRSLIVKDKLRNTSFEPWLNYPIEKNSMVGEATLTLAPDQPVLKVSLRLISQANQWARYVRGPWLKAGEGSFGAAKVDAIFPGVEWLLGDEWSSGTDWFKDPWAKRYIPHPNKVAIPLMAMSQDGVGVGLAWDPRQNVTGWFNYRRCHPQPVFATPNFIDRRSNHLMGLMIPDVDVESHENQPEAEPPLELHMEQRIAFDAEVFLVKGDSLDVIVDWVQRHGMPEPPAPRWPFLEALDRIAQSYITHFWHEGKGFGTEQTPRGVHPRPPSRMNTCACATRMHRLPRRCASAWSGAAQSTRAASAARKSCSSAGRISSPGRSRTALSPSTPTGVTTPKMILSSPPLTWNRWDWTRTRRWISPFCR